MKKKIITIDRTLEKKLRVRYEGPFIVVKVISDRMVYEIEDKSKRVKIHYSHLKVWADPPAYLTQYFQQDEVEPNLKEPPVTNVAENYAEIKKIKYVPLQIADSSDVGTMKKKGAKLKEAWKMLKSMALNNVR